MSSVNTTTIRSAQASRAGPEAPLEEEAFVYPAVQVRSGYGEQVLGYPPGWQHKIQTIMLKERLPDRRTICLGERAGANR